MALAKELVELHHGAISVRSTLHKGTEFIVRLPLGKEHFRKEEIALHKKSGKRDFANAPAVNTVTIVEPVDEQPMPAESPVVLVVEDNDDMRHYIRKTLSPNYQIEEAGNGKEALKIATETLPDLIISDVMMPGMDGYMLCSKMKTNVITSHIPVILLTAKADRESKLAGLELGADDYLSKPFDADELKLVVRNRIKARLEMREHFSKEITLKPNEITVTSLDEKFLTNLLQIIEAHMDDEDFSIEDFSQESGCSRMQFYRKIKGLTGQTPSQFVRSIRLKRAAQLLAGKSDNISQIAYSVGFSSVAYFNKCFKEQFEMTPSQFGQVKKEAAKA
jgi:YesN/AraC family two-component response regulator